MRWSIQLVISSIVLIIAIYTSVYINTHVDFIGYDNLYLLPLLYALLFISILNPLLTHRFNTFLMSYTVVTALRYVLLPWLIVKSGWYIGRSPVDPLSTSFEGAIWLMLWELLLTTLAVALFFSRRKKDDSPIAKTVTLPTNYTVYISFLILAVFVIGLAPEVLNSFSFLMPHERLIDIGEAGFKTSIAQFIVITAKYIVFLLLMTYCYRQYEKQSHILWLLSAFIVVLLNVTILYGDNRSDFLISGIASLYLFYRLFLKKALPFIIGTVFLLVIVFLNITTYRNTTTITNGVNPLVDRADTLQIYAGGPYNVAMALELQNYFPHAATIGNFLYDLTRPVIGLNMFVRNLEGFQFSNYLYNYRIYFNEHVAQIMPMVGQGYFYTGFVFAPCLNIAFVLLAYVLYRVMSRSNRIELIFFLTIPITRIGFMMGQNAGILLNDISFTLLLTIAVYMLNNHIVFKRREQHR